MYSVTLTGGEPLTHPELAKIYRGLNEMGLLISRAEQRLAHQ